MRFLYTYAIYAYSFIITFFSFFNLKAKLWVNGRKNVFDHLKSFKNLNAKPIIWIHCASLGEFEQGRPFIEKLKNRKPEYRILLTFFSPSGYEIRKNYALVDYVSYLPIDSVKNAKKFIEIISPEFVFFVKYEYWYNYIHQLYLKKTPLFIISAIFRDKQLFFKWYGLWFRKQLAKINFFFCQNEESLLLLNKIGIRSALITGDTRFDRVVEICKNPSPIEQFENFSKSNTMIIGSSWSEDEKLIQKAIIKYPKLKLIIAPHDVDEDRISYIENCFSNRKCIRFSKFQLNQNDTFDVVIIDSVGLLYRVYQYGFLAYIGGGFNKGIHNILEATCFGMPIIFGPNYSKFQEAVSLIELGGAFSVNCSTQLEQLILRFSSNPDDLENCSLISKKYTFKNTGATNKIYEHVFK